MIFNRFKIKNKISNSDNSRTKASPNLVCGFTLIEIIISITVLVAISVGIFSSLNTFDSNQALDKDTARVISILEQARRQTLFSKNSSQYGVHFNTNNITLFEGDTYSSSDPENSLTKLHSKVNISLITLAGGGDDVVFERLSGETSQAGTVTLENKLDTLKTIVITIEETGLIK